MYYEIYNLRETFEEYLCYAIDNINSNQNNMDYNYAKNYIEDLFGYKTESQLFNMIIKIYDNAKIEQKENEIRIYATTEHITDYLRPNKYVIDEIIKCYDNYDKELYAIIICIENLRDDYNPNVNPIKEMRYEVDVKNKYITSTIIRKDGSETKDSIEKLDNIRR